MSELDIEKLLESLNKSDISDIQFRQRLLAKSTLVFKHERVLVMYAKAAAVIICILSIAAGAFIGGQFYGHKKMQLAAIDKDIRTATVPNSSVQGVLAEAQKSFWRTKALAVLEPPLNAGKKSFTTGLNINKYDELIRQINYEY